MILAPIILFVYNRPWHTRKTLESLSKNKLSEQSSLYIYLDAPNINATEGDLENIKKVKNIIYEKQWCAKTIVIENTENLGIDYQTPLRLNELFEEFDKIIVLEDDCVLSEGFLKYMNEALNIFKNEEEIMHIAGWIPPVKKKLSNLSFVQGITYNWGWATWKRAWENYNTNIDFLLEELKDKGVDKFDLNNTVNSYSYLKNVSQKPFRQRNWDIIWHASVFIKKGLTLIPGKPLVNNIGMDGSGLHCISETRELYSHKKIATSVKVIKIEIKENLHTRRVLEHFFANINKPKFSDKLKDKMRYEWNKVFRSKSKY